MFAFLIAAGAVFLAVAVSAAINLTEADNLTEAEPMAVTAALDDGRDHASA
jgi:hypothetical protein